MITIYWNNEAQESFETLLINSGIEHTIKSTAKSNVAYASIGTTIVEILNAFSGLGLAGVLIAWITQKSNRKIGSIPSLSNRFNSGLT